MDYQSQSEVIFSAGPELLTLRPQTLSVLATILLRAQQCECQLEYDELDCSWYRIPNRPHFPSCFRSRTPVSEDRGDRKVRNSRKMENPQSPEFALYREEISHSSPREPKHELSDERQVWEQRFFERRGTRNFTH